MCALLVHLLFLLHPIHVSVTEIEYNEKVKSLQIISRIFIDDLELSVRNQINQPDLDILNPKNGNTTEQLVREYLKDHFKIKLDGKLQTMNYLGHEKEDFALVCYIEIENVRKFKAIEVFNDVIMETHDDQSNIVHVTYRGPIKSARLMSDQPRDTFTFEEKK
jgi:hypothetical protein